MSPDGAALADRIVALLRSRGRPIEVGRAVEVRAEALRSEAAIF